MVRKLLVLVTIAAIAGLVLLLTLYNQGAVVLTVIPDSLTFSGSLGVITIGALVIGSLIGGLLALWHALRAYFANHRLARFTREEQEAIDAFIAARTALLTGETKKARGVLERLARRPAYTVLASLELSKLYQESGDLTQAHATIDAIRTAAPHNPEVLLRSSMIYAAEGKKVLALDTIKTFLDKHTSTEGLAFAQRLAFELERYAEALTFTKQLEQPTTIAEHEIALRQLLDSPEVPAPQRLKDLYILSKQYPSGASIFAAIASHERQTGADPATLERAASALLHAAQLTNRYADWQAVRKAWGELQNPEKTLSAVKTALRHISDHHAPQYPALLLVQSQIQLELGMREDALKGCHEILERAPSSIFATGARLLVVAADLPGGKDRDALLAVIAGL